MNRLVARASVAAGVGVIAALAGAMTAVAQVEESDVGSEQGVL